MKIVLFSGSHSRHVYLHQQILKNFDVTGIVCMYRESVLPSADENWPGHDQELFKIHFQNRFNVENKNFGEFEINSYEKVENHLFVEPKELNSQKVIDFLSKIEYDVAIIFGVDIIKEPLFSTLPFWKINIHLGLSPWYRGAATLFWPFYFLEPQFSGATIHQIAPKADAGEIIHHSVPVLSSDDTIHDVGVKVVKQATSDLVSLLKKIENGEDIVLHKQKISGKLFLEKDFRPEHLRIIYDTYNDEIVKHYLDGNFIKKDPKLISNL